MVDSNDKDVLDNIVIFLPHLVYVDDYLMNPLNFSSITEFA